MKNRFFWTIFLVLFAVICSTTVLYELLLRKERLALIDQQVRAAASAIVDSELGGLRKVNFSKVEAVLSEELGETRFGKFFVIRNAANEILYENVSDSVLPLSDIPKDPQWVTVQNKEQYIRVLNLKLPKIEDRTLQVGLIMDKKFLYPTYLMSGVMLYALCIFIIGLAISWLLASNLVKPITVLASFVEGLAETESGRLELPSLPKTLDTYFVHEKPRTDELSRLLMSFEKLIEKVNKGYRLSRLWSYQMAHELKTPLTVITSIVTDLVKSNELKKEKGQFITDEIFKASGTITSFLSWAEVENATAQKNLHVIKASKILTSLIERLNPSYNNRITLQVDSDFSVLANLEQLEQVLSNLLINACNYSPQDRIVMVKVHDQTLEIIDHGKGIPKEVLDHLGDPFNKGKLSKGNGLGLAYAFSLCKLNHWKLEIHSMSEYGTRVQMTFPVLAT